MVSWIEIKRWNPSSEKHWTAFSSSTSSFLTAEVIIGKSVHVFCHGSLSVWGGARSERRGAKHDCVYSYNTTVLVRFILRGCLSFCLSNNLYLSGWLYSMFLAIFRLGNLWFCSLHGLQRRDDCIISYILTFPSSTTVGYYFPFHAKIFGDSQCRLEAFRVFFSWSKIYCHYTQWYNLTISLWDEVSLRHYNTGSLMAIPWAFATVCGLAN